MANVSAKEPWSCSWPWQKKQAPDLEGQILQANESKIKDKVVPFLKAISYGGRTRRSARLLLGMVPLYIMFIFLPEKYAFGFISFAMVLQYITIGTLTPKTFGASAVVEVSVFLGSLLGCLFSTFLMLLAIASNVYVTYVGILFIILISEPTLTSSVLHPFLGLFPWIISDYVVITDLTNTLQKDDVGVISDLWMGPVQTALLRNFVISSAISLGLGLMIFIIPPASLEFAQLYSTTASLLTTLSKQFNTLNEAFREPEGKKKAQVDRLNQELDDTFQDEFEPFQEKEKSAGKHVGFAVDGATSPESPTLPSKTTSFLRGEESESMKITSLLQGNLNASGHVDTKKEDFWALKQSASDSNLASLRQLNATATMTTGQEENVAPSMETEQLPLPLEEENTIEPLPSLETKKSALERTVTFTTEDGDEFVVSRSSSGHSLTREKDLSTVTDVRKFESQPVNRWSHASTDTTCSIAAFKSMQSIHYEHVLDELKSSAIGFEKTRAKVNKTMLTITAAKCEFPLQRPIPIPKRPFSGFSHTCDPVLWRKFLSIVNRTNRDGLGYSDYARYLLAGYILDQGLLNMIADVLHWDSKVLQCLSVGMSTLTNQDSHEMQTTLKMAKQDLQDAQEKHQEAMRAVKMNLYSKHKVALFRRKAVFMNPNSEVGFKAALEYRLTSMKRLKAVRLLNLDALPHHELLDLLLRHYYESSMVAFLALLGGVRMNSEKGSMVDVYQQITDKTQNRTWREAIKAVTDFIFLIPLQYVTEYKNWIQLMYSGLVRFSFATFWKSSSNYWRSTRGRYFFRLFVGLALIFALSMFSSQYRTLFNLGDNGRFGGWQIHAFISSSQNCVEATTKKVFWRVIGNAVGGLVGFLALYISMNKVYHMVYLTVITFLTTWVLNGANDDYFTFTLELGYAIGSFGIVQHLLAANVNSIKTTRDLAIFTAARVLAQIAGTVWALVIGLTVLPSFAYDRAKDLAFDSLNNVVDQVASKAFEIYLGFNDYPLDIKKEYDKCEKVIQATTLGFQQARKDIESAEKFGVVKILGYWFYDGGEADAVLNWAGSVLTCVEGLYHMALRTYSTAMGDYQSTACIYRADSELVQVKIPEQRELCNRLMKALRGRFDAVVQIMSYYYRVKNPKELRGWKAKWRHFKVKRHEKKQGQSRERSDSEASESASLLSQSLEIADELEDLKENLYNKQYEFWMVYLELEHILVPQFTEEEFDVWYTDLYRLDAFLGFLRRLEDLMTEIPI